MRRVRLCLLALAAILWSFSSIQNAQSAPSLRNSQAFQDFDDSAIARPGSLADLKDAFKVASNRHIYRHTKKTELIDSTLTDILTHCPQCLTIDGRYYYQDWLSLATRPFVDRAEGQEVRQADRVLVAACARWAEEGQSVTRLLRSPPKLCRKPHGKDPGQFFSSKVSYQLSKQGGQIHLGMSIHWAIAPSEVSDKEAVAMLAKVRACVPQMTAFWDRYGIKLNLQMDSDRQPSLKERAVSINLIAKDGQSDSGNIYILPWKGEMFCKLLLHETGHLMMLDDEYYDPRCPDREIVSKENDPGSVMVEMSWRSMSEIDFFPRHLRTVLSPLCENIKAPWIP